MKIVPPCVVAGARAAGASTTTDEAEALGDAAVAAATAPDVEAGASAGNHVFAVTADVFVAGACTAKAAVEALCFFSHECQYTFCCVVFAVHVLARHLFAAEIAEPNLEA